MAKVKSLYDAIIKTSNPEDQCTNFLLWLLEKLPSKVVNEICKTADLSISQVNGNLSIEVQYPFENSRPDGIIKFSTGEYLIIETKRFPDRFVKEQFLNHFYGGRNEFGEEKIWLLFLSGDDQIPSELDKLKNKYYRRIGFISWKSVLQLLENSKNDLNEKYKIVIEEFMILAKHYKIGRLMSMKNEEIRRFIEVYPIVAKNQEAIIKIYSEALEKIRGRIVIGCEELVKEDDNDKSNNLPCLYRALKIEKWHTKETSGYLFIDILQKRIGVVLTGYQGKKEIPKFRSQWNETYKYKYKDDTNLCTFTWIGEGEDEEAINAGYFKIVEGTGGKVFDPTEISETENYFYWGYVYDLEIEKIQPLYEIIANDFKKLVDTFVIRDTSVVQPSKKVKRNR